MTKCFLRIGNDTLDEAKPRSSLASAERYFRYVAEDLDRFGQEIDATIHIADSRAELVEDADYHLALGPRGGLVRTKL
jgi:hypothetical protein